MKALRHDLDVDPERIKAWTRRWISDGFAALETMIGQHGGGFAFGAGPTLADCHLVPQLYSAEHFEVDLTPYPAAVRDWRADGGTAAGRRRASGPPARCRSA